MSSNRLIKKEFANQPEEKKPIESKHLTEVKPDPTESALAVHMNSFAAADGFVDQKSIYNACIKAGYSEKDSSDVAKNTMIGAYYCGVPGVSLSFFGGIQGHFKPKDAVPLLTHPKDSGLFDRHSGKFNEALFKILEDKYAIVDIDGEKIISRAKMDEFTQKETNQDKRWEDASWLFKHLGQLGNKGEFDLLFQRGVSRYKNNEGYLKLSDLRQWYINSQPILDKMHDNELPVPPPLKRG